MIVRPKFKRSYHNHGIPSLINSVYLHLSCECFSHTPIVEVFRLSQDDSGLQTCIRPIRHSPLDLAPLWN